MSLRYDVGIKGDMRKNLIAIIILALLVVNTVMTGIMMFSLIQTNSKVVTLVGDISSAIQLDLGIAGSGNVDTGSGAVAMADISAYNLTDTLTIKLASDPEGDGKDHYAVVGITLSLDTTNDDYATYSESMATNEGLIKDEINKVIGSYTYSQIQSMSASDLQEQILEGLQQMYNSQFIIGVSFSSWITQ